VKRFGIPAGLVALVALIACAAAPAAVVTIGANVNAAPTSTYNCGAIGGCTYSQNTPTFVSPVSGVILRWRYVGKGTYALRVIRGNTGIATSSPSVTTTSGIHTVATNLPISAGDRIGIDFPEGFISGLSIVSPADGGVDTWTPQLPNGSSPAPTTVFDDQLLLINADILPTPTISSVSPASGPFIGGTNITIAGTDFSEVKAVSVGGAPVPFRVDSESVITATASPGLPGPTPVAVTTPAGTAVSSAGFTNIACVVPKLKGKTLKADRKILKRANCALGAVKGQRGKRAKVKQQTIPAGAILPAGAKIAVKLG
jgi:hypothetical protein